MNICRITIGLSALLFASACAQTKAADDQTQVAAQSVTTPAAEMQATTGSHVQVTASSAIRTPAARRTAAASSQESLGATSVVLANAPVSAAHGPASTTSATVVPMRAPHEAPTIVSIVLPTHSVTSHQIVRASVYTSSNTASVEARLSGYAMPLERVGVGHFRLVYEVPEVPVFLHRTWPVKVIARNVDGHTVSKDLEISVH